MNRLKRILCASLCTVVAVSACGCGNAETSGNVVSENNSDTSKSDPAVSDNRSDTTESSTDAPENTPSASESTSDTPNTEKPEQSAPVVYEAEEAVLGNVEIINGNGFSGGKAVEKFDNESCFAEFTVTIDTDGMYSITVTSSGIGSDKENNLLIDGSQAGTFSSKSDVLTDSDIAGVSLKKGEHKIKITKSWGWIQLDKITVSPAKPLDDNLYNVTTELVNKNSTAETKKLYEYLCDSYGKYTISGQFSDGGLNGNEFKAIYKETGKYPAMLGLDMMDYTPARQALGASSKSVQTAISFAEKGGILTFCWHWNAPTSTLYSGNDPDNNNPRWWGGFYTRNTSFDIKKVMDGKDSEGKAAIDEDIKAIAKQLKTLEEAGVPVLWRPLHEASGGWFWWGAKGADAYKKLWIYLYEQLTDVYHCNNLIWVYNGQSADWYPGDAYVDIVGEDIYPGEKVYSPNTSKFEEAAAYGDKNKIVALTENGCLFDIDDAVASNTRWAWFATWNGGFVVNGANYSERYTEKEILKKVYTSEYVITLDELPDF